MSVAYTAFLPVDRAACEWFARRLIAHRRSIGTRKGTRRLTPWSQAVFVLRFLIDGTRIAQLAADNHLPSTTAYDNLWEGLEVLSQTAPRLHDAIDAAREAGDGHIGLDGTLIPTTRAQVEGPTKGVDLFWSGKHHRHGVNLQVISAPDGYPLWVAEARPGREHDANAAVKTGVEAEIALLNIGVNDNEHMLVLVDLGYEKFRAFPAVVVPHKAPKGGKLTEAQKDWNRLIGAKRALAEKANADLKMRFRCLQKVSLNPWRIGTIARACLAFFRIERPRRLVLTQSA
ncbi:HARBI1 family protein [Glycomyces salinus]|uniref:HARBI1 family protein n=1 Tax=Glycomyces salinus TaxID=980294 RepID=UPI0018EC05F5|nr:transposase family protein [Glycomyces salinus]